MDCSMTSPIPTTARDRSAPEARASLLLLLDLVDELAKFTDCVSYVYRRAQHETEREGSWIRKFVNEIQKKQARKGRLSQTPGAAPGLPLTPVKPGTPGTPAS